MAKKYLSDHLRTHLNLYVDGAFQIKMNFYRDFPNCSSAFYSHGYIEFLNQSNLEQDRFKTSFIVAVEKDPQHLKHNNNKPH